MLWILQKLQLYLIHAIALPQLEGVFVSEIDEVSCQTIGEEIETILLEIGIHCNIKHKRIIYARSIAIFIYVFQRVLEFLFAATVNILTHESLNLRQLRDTSYEAIEDQILMLPHEREHCREIVRKRDLGFCEYRQVFFFNSTEEIVVRNSLLAADFDAQKAEQIGSAIII